MLQIRYFEITALSDEFFKQQLHTLSVDIQKQILRYRFISDQKLRLMGRILIRSFLEEQNYNCKINDWKLSNDKKPFLPNGPFFNITHSGNIVMVAFSDREVGIDIELIKDDPFNDLVHLFHPNEMKFLQNHKDLNQSFYYIWTRKEAFLKATGKGIIEGLHTVNVLEDVISDNGKHWCLQDISITGPYKCAVCTEGNSEKYDIKSHSLKVAL